MHFHCGHTQPKSLEIRSTTSSRNVCVLSKAAIAARDKLAEFKPLDAD